jgi:MOSC domain-containing protein YiiM
MSEKLPTHERPVVVAVCVSPGGVPKQPQSKVRVTKAGLEGDGRNHAKHDRPARAISLFDEEILLQLRREGYDLEPGSIGENVTLRNVHVQRMQPGTILEMGDVRIRLEEPRTSCYVLDVVDPKLKDDIVGRCGYMASVISEGELAPGTEVVCVSVPTTPR